MLSKNQIKHLKSLSSPKFRQMYNNFVAEGDKIASEIIKSQTFEIVNIYATPDWIHTNEQQNYSIRSKIVEVDAKSMQQISQLKTASPVFIVLNKPNQDVKLNLIENRFCILLDGVQDPGNVGTIIRIADWFGIPNVITNAKSADMYHPKVVQASMGSICHVNLMRATYEEVLSLVKSTKTFALTLDGKTLSSDTFAEPGIIVMGSEGKGVTDELLAVIDHKIYIPGAEYKGAESLNVSVVTGIIGYHVLNNAKKRP